MRKFRRIEVQLLGAVCLLLWPALAGAQYVATDLTEGNRALAKVSSHLLRARALAAAGESAAAIAAAAPILQLRDGLPQVAIRLESLTPEIVESLRDRGLQMDSFHLDSALVYGRLDPADLDEIAAIAEVSTIHPMPRPRRRVGDVTSQGDASMRADDVRSTLGYDGTGVTVGILSDSFNKTGLGGTVSGGSCACAAPGSTCSTVVTGMDNQDSGDLPASIPILDDCTVPMNCTSLTDEGAALGETIFDSAPNADFLFHSAFNSPGDFATGIEQLVNCGADLIIDDVGWTEQALFQDDVIAQAAQEAVEGGVPYFSAAGNDATFGIHDTYKDNDGSTDNPCPDVKVAPDGKDLHDFGSSDPYARVTIPAGCNFYAELQWSETFSGALGAGAASDLDLYLLDAAALPSIDNILAGSITDQGCGVPAANAGDPIETVFYTNTSGSNMDVFLAVEHCCGDESVDLRILNFSFNCFPEVPPYDFESGIFVDAQIYGHPAAKDVMAVGAVFYGEIDSGGALDGPPGQLDVEPYSSKGGALPFYFDGSGNPLPMAPELRHKPEIVGIDGANTTFFGFDIEPDGFPNFFGTSAAAPHATALAVLIWQITGELISPRALHQLIVQAVFDMETAGQDDLSGYGFADALLAASSLDGGTAPLIDDLEFDLEGDDFFTSPPSGLQRLQAKKSLTLDNGNFNGLEGIADNVIFADGFESGDTSAWGN